MVDTEIIQKMYNLLQPKSVFLVAETKRKFITNCVVFEDFPHKMYEPLMLVVSCICLNQFIKQLVGNITMNCKLVHLLELVKAISGTKMDSSRWGTWGCLVFAFLGRKVLTMKKERNN